MDRYLNFIYSNTIYKMHAIFYRIDNFPPNKTYRMPKKYMTRCSTSLSEKSYQKYNTYHHTPV